MEGETNLRQLEQHLKLRVRTGCDICRIRRVKCDETKPSCLKCAKTGRTCGGYNSNRLKSSSPAAAATYRNSNFLVIPQHPRSRQPTISRSPFVSLSPEPQENRSFQYFQTHTLPRWTEFFESEIWSRTVLQLSYDEPAIKHGILALSTMHESLERGTPGTASDIALVQYMRAVRHSNRLLTAHQEGKPSIEKILIACTIFTCFENLAGNYKAANMHLRNGLRILEQHKTEKGPRGSESQEAIGDLLVRFDLQAMTFSDDTSPYQFGLENPPDIPNIPETYTVNERARDDLVKLSRCMLWAAGSADANPQAIQTETFAQIFTQILPALKAWDEKFTLYAQETREAANSKTHAGKTLLRIYSIMMRTIASAGAGLTNEMAWDAFVDDFRTVVDLAETLPMLQPRRHTSPPVRTSPSPPVAGPSTTYPPPAASHNRGSRKADTLTVTFRSDTAFPASSVLHTPTSTLTPLTFSPSFEISPIVPLFLIITRCREPLVRRRALALLLNYRRREGVWDSLAAGIVAAQCLKQEEGILGAEIEEGNWLPLAEHVKEAADVPDWRRLRDLAIELDLKEGMIDISFNGEQTVRREERRRRGGQGKVVTRTGTGASFMIIAEKLDAEEELLYTRRHSFGVLE